VQAPTPDTVALFDDVLLMSEGYEVRERRDRVI
jgi:hypothetical protein